MVLVWRSYPRYLLENYQQADGRIEVPEVLRPYMNDCRTLTAFPSFKKRLRALFMPV